MRAPQDFLVARGGTRPGVEHLAILTALTLRTVFHLALRQTEGFVSSLIGLMDLDLMTPDHTTLSRRSSSLEVPISANQHDGPVHMVIDSTGLKIVGDGEWHAYKHRSSNKRRSWRKLHLAVRDGGLIEASVLTDSGADDATVGEDLLGKIVVGEPWGRPCWATQAGTGRPSPPLHEYDGVSGSSPERPVFGRPAWHGMARREWSSRLGLVVATV